MDEHDETSIIRHCNDLIALYTHLADLGSLERVPDLFTEDGVWATPTEEHRGQPALRARFVAPTDVERTTRHVCTNVLVRVIGPDEAIATVYVTFYVHIGPTDGPAPASAPAKIGQYDDRLVRTPSGWRFAERRCTFAFA